MESVNAETKAAWQCHDEYFEYYAFECPDSWLELSKGFFTHEQGAEECAKIDWTWIKSQLKTTLDFYLEQEGEEIPPADPYYRAFYKYDEEETTS